MIKQNYSKYEYVFDLPKNYTISMNSQETFNNLEDNRILQEKTIQKILHKNTSCPNLQSKQTNNFQTLTTPIQRFIPNNFSPLQKNSNFINQQYKIFRQNQQYSKLKVQISQKEKTQKKGYQYYFKKNDTSIEIPPSLLNKKQQSKTMNYIKYENFQKMKKSNPYNSLTNSAVKAQRASQLINLNKRNSLYSSGYAPTNVRHPSLSGQNINQKQKPKFNTPDILILDQSVHRLSVTENKIQEFEIQDKNRVNRFQQNQSRQINEQANKKQQLTKKFQHIDLRHKAKHINSMIDQKMGNFNISWNDSDRINTEDFKNQRNQNKTSIVVQQTINNNVIKSNDSNNVMKLSFTTGNVSSISTNFNQNQTSKKSFILNHQSKTIDKTSSLEFQIKQLETKRQNNLDQILRQQKFIKQIQQINQQQKVTLQQKSNELIKINLKYQTLGKAYNDLDQRYKEIQTNIGNKVEIQVNKSKKDYQDRLQAFNQKIQKYLAQICKLNKMIQQVEDVHRQNQKELILKYQKDIQLIKSNHKNEFNKQSQAHKQQLVNITKYYQQKQKKLLENQKSEIKKIQQNHQVILQNINQQNNNKVQKLISQHQKSLTNLQISYETKEKQSLSKIAYYQEQLKEIPTLKQTISSIQSQLMKQKTQKYSLEKQLNGYKLYVEELKKINKASQSKYKEKQLRVVECQKELGQIKQKLVKKQKQIDEQESLLNVFRKEVSQDQMKIKIKIEELERLKRQISQLKLSEIKNNEKISFLQTMCKQFKNYDQVEYEIIFQKVKQIYNKGQQNIQQIVINLKNDKDQVRQSNESIKQQTSVSPSTSALTNMKLKKKMSLVDRNLQLQRDLHSKKNQCEQFNAKIKDWQGKYNELLGIKHQQVLELTKIWERKIQEEKIQMEQLHKTNVNEFVKIIQSLNQQIKKLKDLNDTLQGFESTNVSKIAELEEQIRLVTEKMNLEKQNIENHQQKYLAFENKIQALEIVIQGKDIEIEKILSQSKELQNKLKEIQEKLGNVEKQLAEAKGNEDKLKKKIEESKIEKRQYKNQIQELEKSQNSKQQLLKQQEQNFLPCPSSVTQNPAIISPQLQTQIQYLTKVQQFYNQVLQVFGLEQLNFTEMIERMDQINENKGLKRFKSHKLEGYSGGQVEDKGNKGVRQNKQTKNDQNKNEMQNFENDNNRALTQFDYQEEENASQQNNNQQGTNIQNSEDTDTNQKNIQQNNYPRNAFGSEQDQASQSQPQQTYLQSLYTKISSNQQQLLHIVNQWIRKLQRQAFSITQYKQKSLFLQQKFKQAQQQISLLSQQKVQICQKYEMLVNKFQQENGQLEEKVEEMGQKHTDMESYIKEIQELLHEANKKCMTFGLFGLEICKREKLEADIAKIYLYQEQHCYEPEDNFYQKENKQPEINKKKQDELSEEKISNQKQVQKVQLQKNQKSQQNDAQKIIQNKDDEFKKQETQSQNMQKQQKVQQKEESKLESKEQQQLIQSHNKQEQKQKQQGKKNLQIHHQQENKQQQQQISKNNNNSLSITKFQQQNSQNKTTDPILPQQINSQHQPKTNQQQQQSQQKQTNLTQQQTSKQQQTTN